MDASDRGFTLAELANQVGGQLRGNGDIIISCIGTLRGAGAGAITFLANMRYRHQLADCRASAVIVAPDMLDDTTLPAIVLPNPYAGFARISQLLNPVKQRPRPFIDMTAVLDPTAVIGSDVHIGAHVVVGARSQIGAGCTLAPGTIIGDDVSIGDESFLHPRVTVYDRCLLGQRVVVHSGVVIGSDGFGMAQSDEGWIKIPQVGRVIIGDNVEIGANTTIDRGAIEDTVIEEGVKLDNQIQIAHNVRIGMNTVIAGCAGIAGSTRIGRNCMIGGAAMVVGHLQVADNVMISGGTLVTKSITVAGQYSSSWPSLPNRQWLKQVAHVRQLPELSDRLTRLEQFVGIDLTESESGVQDGRGQDGIV